MLKDKTNKLQKYSKPVLRIGMALFFLYFGFQQVLAPSEWIGFIPAWARNLGVSLENLIFMNALLELSFGSLLLIGLYTRVSALILALHTLSISILIGFNPLGVRDLGLAVATFVVFLNGCDKFCADKKFNNKAKTFIK